MGSSAAGNIIPVTHSQVNFNVTKLEEGQDEICTMYFEESANLYTKSRMRCDRTLEKNLGPPATERGRQ